MKRPFYTKFDVNACIQTQNVATVNNLYWITGFRISLIDLIEIMGSCVNGTSSHTKFGSKACLLTLNVISEN